MTMVSVPEGYREAVLSEIEDLEERVRILEEENSSLEAQVRGADAALVAAWRMLSQSGKAALVRESGYAEELFWDEIGK